MAEILAQNITLSVFSATSAIQHTFSKLELTNGQTKQQTNTFTGSVYVEITTK